MDAETVTSEINRLDVVPGFPGNESWCWLLCTSRRCQERGSSKRVKNATVHRFSLVVRFLMKTQFAVVKALNRQHIRNDFRVLVLEASLLDVVLAAVVSRGHHA